MALSHKTRSGLRGAAVWAKYLSPAAVSLAVLIGSALPVWSFSDGDGTYRVHQSVFELVSSVSSSVSATLAKTSAEPADIALANALRPSVWVFWIVTAVCVFYSFLLLGFALALLPKDPCSAACNRIKVSFRFWFPGRAFHLLLPVFSTVPLGLPYYVLSRFSRYYAVSGTAPSGSGGTTFSYYEYSLRASPVNPLLIAVFLALAAVILFFVAMPFENSRKADLYRYYEPEPQKNAAKKG